MQQNNYKSITHLIFPDSAPSKAAQRLRMFLSILVVPNNTVICMIPITSGIPNYFKYCGRHLGSVHNLPITIGMISVLTLCIFWISWAS